MYVYVYSFHHEMRHILAQKTPLFDHLWGSLVKSYNTLNWKAPLWIRRQSSDYWKKYRIEQECYKIFGERTARTHTRLELTRHLEIPKKIDLIPIPIPGSIFGINSNSNSEILNGINSNSNSDFNSGKRER